MSGINERAGKALAGRGLARVWRIPNADERRQGYATSGPWRDPETGMLWVVARPEYVWTPDMTDPATLGAFLAVVREAWGDPGLHIRYDGWIRMWTAYASDDTPLDRLVVDEGIEGRERVAEQTEEWCLVVALEAAPTP